MRIIRISGKSVAELVKRNSELFLPHKTVVKSEGNGIPIEAGWWQHLAIVRENDSCAIYRNSEAVANCELRDEDFTIELWFRPTSENIFIGDIRITRGVARYEQNNQNSR
ncbi:MAG: hypothetical protein LUQ29_15655 [Methylococcaceae bacterium]|jgi:hypothetical protein|nr:hypothetical protein [Methylococcaceae bacterium]